jgi:putative ABC transport system permease protein
MTFARTGTQRLRVVGILADDDAQALQTGYITSLETYERQFTEDVDAAVYVRGADGVQPAAVEQAINQKLQSFPTAVLRSPEAAAQERMATVDNMLGLVTVLLLLAATIALLGITNTLALSILERRREVGLLRAVGTTRSQIAAMIRWEAALVAVLGGIVGVALGVMFGWAAVGALGDRFNLTMAIPGGRLLVYLVVAGAAGLLARRAARRAGRRASTCSVRSRPNDRPAACGAPRDRQRPRCLAAGRDQGPPHGDTIRRCRRLPRRAVRRAGSGAHGRPRAFATGRRQGS